MARKKATTEVAIEALDPRIYEIGYLLSPAVHGNDLNNAVNELQTLITDNGGTIIASGDPEFIDIAYEMIRVIENKNIRFNQAYFGWIKFSIEPKQIAIIKELFEARISIIRFMIIKTVEENTVIAKSPLSKILQKRKELTNSDDEVTASVDAESDTDDVLADIVTPDTLIDDVTRTVDDIESVPESIETESAE